MSQVSTMLSLSFGRRSCTQHMYSCLLASFAMIAIPWRKPSLRAALLPVFLWIASSWVRGDLGRLGFVSSFGPFVSGYLLLLMNPEWMKRIGCSPQLYAIPAAVAGLYGVLVPEVAADDIGLELDTERRRKSFSFINAMVVSLVLLYLTNDTGARHWIVATTVLINVWRQLSLGAFRQTKEAIPIGREATDVHGVKRTSRLERFLRIFPGNRSCRGYT